MLSSRALAALASLLTPLAFGEAPGKPALADLSFVGADGRPTRLREIMARGPKRGTWLVRVRAGWCGTCEWYALDTRSLVERFGSRLGVVDVILADEDNQPPTPARLRGYASHAPKQVHVMADPERRLQDMHPPPAPLPWILLVDGATGAVRETLFDPGPDALRARLARELGDAEDEPAVALHDDIFTSDEWRLIRQMRLPAAPPPDPSNRVADDPAAVELGRELFTDRSLSPSGRVSCLSCHDPALVFTNGKDTAAEGVGPGVRNVPSLVLASHARWQLWDGRADSLWGQAVLPFEDASEYGSSRLFVAHAIAVRHRSRYERLFGALPPLENAARFPASGRPGDAVWTAMTPQDRAAVTGVLANAGKAIAAFERGLRVKPNALDRYADGDRSALSAEQKLGLQAFLRAGCAQCHHGPRLSDDAFHNLRFPTGKKDGSPDTGRIEGVPLLLASEFRRGGAFSDGAKHETPAPVTREPGAFKTPSLRGVPFTMPYGHGGGFGGLASVIEMHRTGGLPAGSRYAVGSAEPWAQGFDSSLAKQILAFLMVLHLDVEDAGLARPSQP